VTFPLLMRALRILDVAIVLPASHYGVKYFTALLDKPLAAVFLL
jgi:hypothetical protein